MHVMATPPVPGVRLIQATPCTCNTGYEGGGLVSETGCTGGCALLYCEEEEQICCMCITLKKDMFTLRKILLHFSLLLERKSKYVACIVRISLTVPQIHLASYFTLKVLGLYKVCVEMSWQRY